MKTATVRETEHTTRVTEIEIGDARPPKGKKGHDVKAKAQPRIPLAAKVAAKVAAKLQAFYIRMLQWMIAHLTFKMELVTPELAAQYLATTVRNRKSVQAVIDQFADNILAGFWGINPQSIVFDTAGHLLDGAHRLAAIIKSGIAIPMVVVRGVPPESFDILDGGTARSLKQIMAADHIPLYAAVASIVRTVIIYMRAKYTTIQFASGVSNRQGLGFYYSNEKAITSAAAWGVKVKAGEHGTVAGGGFVAYVLFSINPAKAAEFLDGIATGANLPANSPILKYRNKYAVLRAQGSVHRNTQVDMMFEAWNEWNGHKTERVRMVIPYGLDLASPTVTSDPLAKF